MEEAPEEPNKYYTRIVMEKIDEGFRQRLEDMPQKRGGFSVKAFTETRIEDFLKTVEKGTVIEHGAYAQMVWELAITAPIEYMKRGPIRTSRELEDLQKRLQAYNFRLLSQNSDGFERPVDQ